MLSTEERISVPRIVQMLNPVRSKQTAQPLLHLAAATSLSTTTLLWFCHRIAVIDGIACPLAHQEDIPRYGKALLGLPVGLARSRRSIRASARVEGIAAAHIRLAAGDPPSQEACSHLAVQHRPPRRVRYSERH